MKYSYVLIFLICLIKIVENQIVSNYNSNGLLNSSTLIMAQVLFRHGERTPLKLCPNDPWKDSFPNGKLGKLTNLGKLQQYNLGVWLRKRYKKLLKEGYTEDTVYVESSEVKRTMMSAAVNLAGLFPPKKNQIWHKSLNWQPIPINVLRRTDDTTLFMSRYCPLHEKLFKEYRYSNEVKLFLKKHQSTFSDATKYCGCPIENLSQASHMFDALTIELSQNKSISWIPLKLYKQLEKMSIFNIKYSTATHKMARLKGFLLKKILDNFSRKINRKDQYKFWIYSAHDSTITSVLNSMGLFNDVLPSFCACVMFELHKLNKKHYIKIVYRDNEASKPRVLCEYLLDDFIENYKDIIPTGSYQTECEITCN